MDRFEIDSATNTLVEYKSRTMLDHVDYITVPHQHEGQQIDRIGPRCFDRICAKMLCVEEGVEYLEDRALENAYIQEVWLPRGMKVGERCFADSILKKIHLPNNLHTIKAETFMNCEELTEIDAVTGVNTIGYNAFTGCTSLREARFGIVKTIRNGAFSGCTSLEKLDLGRTVKCLEDCLFAGCNSLETLKIEGSFDKFSINTFREMPALRELVLDTDADSLEFLPDGFSETSLAEITFLRDVEPIVGHRNCFPDDILFRVKAPSKVQDALGYYFDFAAIS